MHCFSISLIEIVAEGTPFVKECSRTRLAAELRFHLSLAAGVELSLEK